MSEKTEVESSTAVAEPQQQAEQTLAEDNTPNPALVTQQRPTIDFEKMKADATLWYRELVVRTAKGNVPEEKTVRELLFAADKKLADFEHDVQRVNGALQAAVDLKKAEAMKIEVAEAGNANQKACDAFRAVEMETQKRLDELHAVWAEATARWQKLKRSQKELRKNAERTLLGLCDPSIQAQIDAAGTRIHELQNGPVLQQAQSLRDKVERLRTKEKEATGDPTVQQGYQAELEKAEQALQEKAKLLAEADAQLEEIEQQRAAISDLEEQQFDPGNIRWDE